MINQNHPMLVKMYKSEAKRSGLSYEEVKEIYAIIHEYLEEFISITDEVRRKELSDKVLVEFNKMNRC